MLFEDRALDCIGRTKTMLERDAGAQVLHLRLHHRAQVAGRVVAKIQDLARVTVKDDDHPTTYLSSGHRHRTSSTPILAKILERLLAAILTFYGSKARFEPRSSVEVRSSVATASL